DAQQHAQPAQQEHHSTDDDGGTGGGYVAGLRIAGHRVGVAEVPHTGVEEENDEQDAADQDDEIHTRFLQKKLLEQLLTECSPCRADARDRPAAWPRAPRPGARPVASRRAGTPLRPLSARILTPRTGLARRNAGTRPRPAATAGRSGPVGSWGRPTPAGAPRRARGASRPGGQAGSGPAGRPWVV